MYLKSQRELQEVIENAPSEAVILNRPQIDGEERPLSMGRVLNGLLDGPTKSFTALVGYFGHRVDEETIERYRHIRQSSDLEELDDQDLAELIVHETIEENIQVGDGAGQTAFRLLAGAMSSSAARDAARAWYWLCRFRHEAKNGREATCQFRNAFLHRFNSTDDSFISAAIDLLCNGAYADSPFNLNADDFVGALNTTGTSTSRLKSTLKETLFDSVLTSDTSSSSKGAAILLGFFLQRRTDFRMNPQAEEDGAIFHPKIYVVERGDEETPQQTGAIVGSHNWTVPGLGLESGTGAGTSNVEVATLHVDPGHHWKDGSRSNGSGGSLSLGSRVCGTARQLFETADFSIGAWNDQAENLLPAHRLKEVTESQAGQLELKRETESRETFRSLLVYLRHLVSSLSRVNLDDQHDEFLDRFRLTGSFEQSRGNGADRDEEGYRPLFSGKIPASYQVDGAIRLLSILEGTNGEEGARGAFLTDEAGLGKTLSAKMTMAIQAATRLSQRNVDGRPLKMSLVVPAALTGDPGKGGRAPSGWHLHAREIRMATEALLADVCKGIEPDEAARLTHDGHFQIQVISQGIFSTDKLPDAENKEDVATDDIFDESSESMLDDFQFIAESELVTIDESHAFRNQRSRRTRTIRLLLSLPVPGETDWPLVPPSGEEYEADNNWTGDIRRRVLCLSATPFNNRIDDIITQIGHFSQHQDWERPYGTVGQKELQGEGFQQPLDTAIEHWRTSNDIAERKAAFRTILGYARRHLHRTRTLSVPADQLEEQRREGNTEELRSRYDDLGPEYIWPDDASNYQRAFAKALEWLHGEEDGEAMSDEERERKRFDARQELEAVLTSLFVQRSRIRALRIIEAADATAKTSKKNGAPSQAAQMFRKPRRPRQPLALNRSHRTSQSGSQTLEAAILDNLFRLMYPEASEEGEGGGEDSPQLTLRAYEVSALRGQRSAQAARNAIGFQVTNLIKRLQSSPYSFFRTLINGLFRRSITELALVERLLEEAEDGVVQLPDTLDGEALRAKIDEMAEDLASGRYPSLSNVIDLIGGDLGSDGFGRPSLCQVVGLEEDSDGQIVHPKVNEAEEHYEELVEILEGEADPFLWDPEAAGGRPDEEKQGWVALVLSEVQKGTDSSLWHDITTILDVAEQLTHHIWGRGNNNVGRPFSDIWEDFQSMSSREAPGVADWLTDRLETDERARTLFAWLLVQAAARTNSEDDPARDRIRGGGRTLIFTEYKDTQDYLLALFAGLYVVFQEDGASGRRIQELRRLLLDGMRQVVSDLQEQSEAVTQADTERFHYTDPTNFAPPVVGGTEGWLEGWIAEVRESPERFAEAAQDLCETFVRVYGDGVERLIGEGDIHPRAGKNLSFVDLSIDSQVDAFSPWYQLEPETDIESAEEALGYVERLEAAAAFPVHTLLTTDVLAEGVNLQECGVVVHFDLPWNPTKLIQRNGRIDRRLNPTFENLERREALHDQLVEKARSTGKSVSEKDWVAPSFYPPEQVYHLTVLPIEPEVLQSGGNQALATRVRESLQEKLEAIRTLFGLSNWPIVLTHEDSQEVLTGELDFETPGFRRREDLFAALRQLEDGAAEANERFKSFDAQLSVHVRVPLEERRRIIDLFADPDDPEIEEAWGRVKAAGIVSWTGPRPESSVVYADHDWTKANREGRGAISGVLVVEDEEADGGVSYITWGVARETGAQDTIGRRILPVYIRPTDLESQIAESNFLELTRMSALSDWNMLEGAAPSAPSELAADLLKAIIDLAVDGERIAQDRERKNEVIPLDDLTVDLGTPITDILNESSLLNTVIDNQQQPVSRRPQFGDGSTRVKLSTDAGKEDRSDKPPAFNLWVSFAELN